MEQKDIESAWRLVSSFLSQFAVAPVYTLGEFEARYFEDSRVDHYAGLPDRKVQQVHSYVIEDPQTHEITDFVSYFHFLQRVIGNPKHEFIKSSFIEIVVPNPALNGPERSAELVDNLILASSNAGMDQVECVDLMNASSYLERCGFRKGTGKMLYYLHNWLTGSPIDSANWAILQL
jgi:glycylpeptide N-tetradecanoyltransferase